MLHAGSLKSVSSAQNRPKSFNLRSCSSGQLLVAVTMIRTVNDDVLTIMHCNIQTMHDGCCNWNGTSTAANSGISDRAIATMPVVAKKPLFTAAASDMHGIVSMLIGMKMAGVCDMRYGRCWGKHCTAKLCRLSLNLWLADLTSKRATCTNTVQLNDCKSFEI